MEKEKLEFDGKILFDAANAFQKDISINIVKLFGELGSFDDFSIVEFSDGIFVLLFAMLLYKQTLHSTLSQEEYLDITFMQIRQTIEHLSFEQESRLMEYKKQEINNRNKDLH